MPEPSLTQLFVTPLLQWETGEEELRDALLRDVHARRSGERSLGAERIGLDCFKAETENGERFLKMIDHGFARFCELVAEKPVDLPVFSLTGCARLLNKGDLVELRDGGEADLSGMFFLDIGDGTSEKVNGFLEFIDPRTAIKMLPGRRLSANARAAARPGLLLMYPGWLKRLVYPYLGEKPRILIDFDLRFGASVEDEDSTGGSA
jgi:hypothetical protein